MRAKIALVGAVVALGTVVPGGFAGVASACPDPDNPCDVQPQEVPLWCKLSPTC